MTRRRRSRRYSSLPTLLFFLGPTFAIIGVMRLWPIGEGVYLSFTNWDGINPPQWVGIANFRQMLHDPVVRTALLNSCKILAFAPVWVLGPLLLASFIHDRVPWAAFFKVAYVLPLLVSPAVIGTLFIVILGPSGPLNSGLRLIGLGSLARPWTVDTGAIMWIIGALMVWSTFGLGVLFFSAALSSIDPALYESARLDGASWFAQFRFVTLPSVKDTVSFWTIIVAITSFSASTSLVYAFSGGGPGYASTTLDMFIYNEAFRYGSPGYASAVGISAFLLIAVGLIAYLRIVDRGRDTVTTAGTVL